MIYESKSLRLLKINFRKIFIVVILMFLHIIFNVKYILHFFRVLLNLVNSNIHLQLIRFIMNIIYLKCNLMNINTIQQHNICLHLQLSPGKC